MRNALIVGAGGQDGRLLAQLLLDRKYVVAGWVRQESTCAPPIDWALVDILDPIAVERELKRRRPDEIYYFAAFHHSTEDLQECDPGELLRRSFDVHVSGLLNVLHAMKRHCRQSRLFYAASSHVFGNSAPELADENTPFRPDSAYAISKTAGLRCCQLLRQQDHLFAATGILFHHDSSLRKPSFVSQKIVRGALKAQRDPASKLSLGDLDAMADWGYAPDYVDAIFRILQLPQPDDFVVASGELHSVREFAEAAFKEVGLDWRKHVESDARLLKRRIPPLRGNSEKLRAATGWTPSVDFKTFVSKLVHETEEIYEVG